VEKSKLLTSLAYLKIGGGKKEVEKSVKYSKTFDQDCGFRGENTVDMM